MLWKVKLASDIIYLKATLANSEFEVQKKDLQHSFSRKKFSIIIGSDLVATSMTKSV